MFTADGADVVSDPDVDVVVEMIGGVEPARTLIVDALRAGKPVITANKELIARHGPDLFAIAADSGVDLLFDKENGFLERLMTTPIHRSSVILSRFIFVMTITSLQVLVILGVAFLFGVQPATGLLGIATILMIGMLFGVGLTAISMAMAFSVKSHGDFFSVLGFLSLPMIFLSSALVPLAGMPAWMGFLARFNPMTWAIDAVRPLILSGWTEALPHVAMVVVVMVIFDALCLYGSAKVFRRAMG
jgi:ABC-2 type transport system permease protein